MGLERFVGHYVSTKERLPSDRRGETIPMGTSLFVLEMVGDQHFNLSWPGGRRAANQVHYSKLMTNPYGPSDSRETAVAGGDDDQKT